MKPMIQTPGGQIIPRDNKRAEVWLAFHRMTPSGLAAVVSLDGHEAHCVTIPAALIDIGDAFEGFGFDRAEYDRQQQRWIPRLVPICWCEAPGFILDQKGLR